MQDIIISPTEIGIFYLGQAGFVIQSPRGKRIVIDAYLSHAAERLFGFKRMIPAVVKPGEVKADFWLSTHEHIDHLDLDVLPAVSEHFETFFIGALDCEKHYKKLGFPQTRYSILSEGEEWSDGDFTIRAVYADHGELAPDAVGYLLEMDGVRIYHTGDTAFRPEEIIASLKSDVNIMVAPINGQFGNMNAQEACELAAIIKPEYIIPSHFWMFLEHVGAAGSGDPSTFLLEAGGLPSSIKAKVMAPGELWKYKSNNSSV